MAPFELSDDTRLRVGNPADAARVADLEHGPGPAAAKPGRPLGSADLSKSTIAYTVDGIFER